MTPAEDPVTPDPQPPVRRPAAPLAQAGPPLRVLTDRELDKDIPYGVRIAASWAWRLGLLLLVGGALVWLLR
jgi:hypothetical protein